MNRVSKRLLSLLPCCMLFGPGSAQAVICKSIDEQGLVSYTDTPVSECAHPVKLRGHSSYTPRPVERNADTATVLGRGGEPDDKGFPGYVSLRIVQPSGGAVIHSNEGKVPVQITLEPALQKGHRIQLILDGQPVGSALASSDAVLSGIERGTHQLSAQVLDRNGGVLGSMNSVEFTLRHEIIQSEEEKRTREELRKKREKMGYRPDFDPGTAYQPKQADYQPKPTPGYQPNYAPAYQPNYTPRYAQ